MLLRPVVTATRVSFLRNAEEILVSRIEMQNFLEMTKAKMMLFTNIDLHRNSLRAFTN